MTSPFNSPTQLGQMGMLGAARSNPHVDQWEYERRILEAQMAAMRGGAAIDRQLGGGSIYTARQEGAADNPVLLLLR
jgi:hypothetical protein